MFNFKFIKMFSLLLFLNLFSNVFPENNNNLFSDNLYSGDLAYKNGDLGTAMLCWKRAEVNSGLFNKIKVLERIYLLKELTGQTKISDFNVLKNIKFVKDYFVSVIRTLPYIIIKFLFLLFWILIFLNIRKLIKRKKKLLIIFLFTKMIFLGAIFVARHNLDFNNYGVIMADKTEVYSGLGQDYPVVSILPAATVVKIDNKFNGYFKVKNKGTVGFVDQKCLERII